MTKVIKVSDETHERLTALKGDGETIDDVIAKQLDKPAEAVDSKWFIGVDMGSPDGDYSVLLRKEEDGTITVLDGDYKAPQKIASEATPQRVSNRKTAGGKPRSAADTFTPADTPQPLEQSCCAGRSPCKHWSYEANEMMYVNSLSGRRKAPEE